VKLIWSLALTTALAWTAPLTAHAQQKVRLVTSAGDIVVEVDAERAPKSAENFLRYVKAGHYNGVIFHRVIENFMIQTGGYKPDLSEKPTLAPIPLEVGRGLSNVRGSLAMARTGDPNSATSQFFINVADNARLDDAGGGYAVFGKVVEGMDVVDQIRAVPTRVVGVHGNLPEKTILIKKASLEK
jgi:peptidyl-prolyl cis-trans isomerase A (cyclophilin A)